MVFAAIAKAIFGSANDRQIKKYQPKVDAINALEPEMAKLTDAELQGQDRRVQGASSPTGKKLDDLIVPAFAVVREASKRTLGMRHFDVQLIGGMVLNERAIAEMRTGEGKTLVATLPVYLNALDRQGRPRRHGQRLPRQARQPTGWARSTTSSASASASSSTGSATTSARRAYAADVTYGTNNEFGFDYLRDNMKYSRDQMVQRGHAYAIVDEVDSILIDEARTPLIISGPTEDRSDLYIKVDEHHEADRRGRFRPRREAALGHLHRERHRKARGAAARRRAAARARASTTSRTSTSCTTPTRRCARTRCSTRTRTTSSATTKW